MARRRSEHRSVKTVYLFCEGTKTERNYFEKFRAIERIKQINIKVRKTNKTDPIGLIKEAILFRSNAGRDFFKDDELFCVFDRNGNLDSQLKRAKDLAAKNGVKLLFSNPCFEYWILCHFEKHESGCEISDIITKLNKHLNGYQKNDYELYTKTKDNLSTAIKNAKEANKKHVNIDLISRKSNPSTNVYELIEYLLSLRK
jgi:hypothetical protein